MDPAAKVSALLISEVELCVWLGEACTGDTLVYHRGSLAHDRSRASDQLTAGEKAELARVARRALATAIAGHAELSQRKLGLTGYEYRLTVRPRYARASCRDLTGGRS